MKNKNIIAVMAAFSLVAFFPLTAFAHCDALDGPVVAAAKQSLETGNVNYVLVWVKKEDEKIVKDAFQDALQERASHGTVSGAADMAFFETLVKIHREGEGAEFTGLKPAGSGTEPIVLTVDESIKKRSAADLQNILSKKLESQVSARFDELMAKRNYDVNDTEAGREFIETYVSFVHYIENVDKSMSVMPAHGETAGNGLHGTHHDMKTVKKELYASWSVTALSLLALAGTALGRKRVK